MRVTVLSKKYWFKPSNYGLSKKRGRRKRERKERERERSRQAYLAEQFPATY